MGREENRGTAETMKFISDLTIADISKCSAKEIDSLISELQLKIENCLMRESMSSEKEFRNVRYDTDHYVRLISMAREVKKILDSHPI